MKEQRHGGWVLLGVIVVFAFPAFALGPFAVSESGRAASTSSVGAIFHNSNSTNWAGYAVSASTGSVTFVNGSWIVPAISGKCPRAAQYSSFWVGIDGYTSSTVEQTGTDSDCQHGKATYYAWYEFYPKGSVLIKTLTISPGDTILASVRYSSSTSKFTVSIEDVSTATSFSTSSSVTSAARSSAEWIAEAPSSFSGVLPLANFGTVDFGQDYTGLAATSSATIGGTTGLFGSFSGLVAIDMINSHHTALKASTGAVSTDLSSFTVTWKSKGP